MEPNNFVKLASIDVSSHVEKKANLTYLSWAWAVDQLMRVDPQANWQFHEPTTYGQTMMVSCTVTAFGKSMTMQLPVMDHRNKAIANPDAFEVNKNMMRCLVKCIAVHGLGLYIYAGEDLPVDESGQRIDPTAPWAERIAAAATEGDLEAVGAAIAGSSLTEDQKRAVKRNYISRKNALKQEKEAA